MSVLAALGLSAPAVALAPATTGQASPLDAAPSASPQAVEERGPVGAARPASPVPEQPLFTG